jgi:hypothetical protein
VLVVAVVVQVHLDLAQAALGERGERVQVLGLILLSGEEEAVTRRPTVGVAKAACQLGIAVKPAIDPAPALLAAGVAPERLVVIAKRHQQVPGAHTGLVGQPAQGGAQVTAEPAVHVTVRQSKRWQVSS